MCGIVTAIGSDVKQWTVGDRVLSTFLPDHQTGQVTEKELAGSLGLPLNGVLATHRVFPAHSLVKAPSYLSDEEACTLPIAAVTAWMSINGMRPLGQNGGKESIFFFKVLEAWLFRDCKLLRLPVPKVSVLVICIQEIYLCLEMVNS